MSTTAALDTVPNRADRTRLRGLGGQWAVFAGCLVVWQLVTLAAQSPYFPTPLRISTVAWQQWFSAGAGQLFLTPAAYADILPSLGRLLLGWLSAALIGISAGMLLGRSRTALAYCGPLLAFARSIPPPALVPVFLVLFQLGLRMQLATIIFGALWPILLNTAEGARAVDQTKTDTARAFRIPRAPWLWHVVLPAALPKIFAGLRVSLSLALTMMVISELTGATNGIGYTMTIARDEFRYTEVWTGIVLLGVLGYTLNAILLAVQRRLLAAER